MLWLQLFIAALLPVRAPACPMGYPTVLQELLRSRAVVVGRVSAERAVPDSMGDRGGWYEGTAYSVQVAEVLRGTVPETFEVFSENSTGRFPMLIGGTYLLFVYRGLGRYAVDNCGHSGLLRERAAELAAVRGYVRQLQPPN